MSQPPVYNRSASFTNLQAANPSGQPPGSVMDVEFNSVKATLDAALANLARIQRDDGALTNASVGRAQLSSEVTVGFSVPAAWATGTAYVSSPAATVFDGGKFYSCLVSHTAGVFATDLAAGKWILIADLTAIPLVSADQISVTTSGLLTADVQGSLEALDAGKAASSHTHPASAISDSTSAGRTLLTATLAAQKSALGLGALAFLDTIPVTNITAQLAFSGEITPAALVANTNDWAPTGLATAAVVRVSASSAINLTGILAQSNGDLKLIENVGTFNITMTASDTSSAAANRLLLSRPLILRPGQAVPFKYDMTAAGWRMQVPLVSHPVSGGFKNLSIKVATTTTVTVAADALTIEDANGESWRLQSFSATCDLSANGAVNKLDAGTVAINTFYNIWVIGNPTTGVVGTLASTSATAPTMPSGFTFKARFGAVQTINATATLYGTWQLGRRAQYVVGLGETTQIPSIASGTAGTVGSAGATTWVSKSVSRFVPATASRIAVQLTNGYAGGAGANVVVAPNNSYSGFSSANTPPASLSAVATLNSVVDMVLESTNIYWASSAAGGAIGCFGWEDNI